MPIRGPVSAQLVKKETCEVVKVGPMSVYLMEDGTNTESRIGCMVLELPGGASGPPLHWHRFHDECFYVTKGTVTFVTPDGDVDAAAGDLMVVPPRAIHTFKNASETESAEFFMTSTPGYYMDYFRILGRKATEGTKLGPAETEHLMALFGTFPPDVESEP